MTRREAIRRVAAIGLLVAVVLVPALATAAPAPPYDHRWQVEGLLVGDVGGTEKSIVADAMTLSFADGRYAGTVAYSDVLGIYDGSSAYAQVADVRLALTGTPLQGGSAAGGTFTGTVTLTTRPAASLAEAASKQQLDLKGGDTRTYDVAGHWAAQLNGPSATGEVLYQTATARGGSGPARSVAWFNRVGEEIGDQLGTAQSFTVAVTGVPSRPTTPGKTSPAAPSGPSGGAPAAESPAPRLSALAYITRGYYGIAPVAPVPVSSEQARAAQALRDAAPASATPLPQNAVTIDLNVAGAYLDAKNRAAGLLGDRGPLGAFAEKGLAAAVALRAKAEALSHLPVPSAPGSLANQLIAALKPQADAGTPGARALAEDARVVAITNDPTQLAQIRAYLSAAVALAPAGSLTSVLAAGADSARAVAIAKVPTRGTAADAVLAAADAATTPDAFAQVASMTREPALDATVPSSGALPPATGFAAHPTGGLVLPLVVLRSHAETPAVAPPVLSWDAATGPVSVSPPAWLAYRRADGTEFWLAGDSGPVALRDASLTGWAFDAPRAALVSAGDAGRVYALYELP